MNSSPLLIGTSRAAPPPSSAVSLLAPERVISSKDLPALDRPCVVLGGGLPCEHWRHALIGRNDILYVLVPPTGETPPAGGGADAVLPSAHPASVRRHLARLLELKQRYLGSLPRFEQHAFSWKGHTAMLTETESELLRLLYQREGEVVGREELAATARCPAEGSRALDAHIHRLRQKLTMPGVEIRTERQRGFRMHLA